MSIWDFIPKIFIVTTKGSKRHKTLEKSLEYMNIPRDKVIHNTERPACVKTLKMCTLGCTQNHLNIYKQGKKYPYILVFEDDVYIKDKNILKNLKKIKQFIQQEKDWDIIYLGHFPWKIGKQHNNLYESVSWCTHAYIISRKAMNFFSQFTAQEIYTIANTYRISIWQKLFTSEGGGIDTFMAKYSCKKMLKTYCIYPQIIYQNSIPGWNIKADISQFICGTFGSIDIFSICLAIIFIIVITKCISSRFCS